jgi:hypothetical protein
VQDKFAGMKPRSFNPMSIPGLSNKAREAVKDVFEAMSDWRTETADDSGRNTKRVIEKLAVAAAALGWPEQIVDSARAQMQSVAEMQIRTMDHMMDVWEEQLKNPSTPSAMLSRLSISPNFGSAAANPLQFWMQSAEQWQKLWTDALTSFWSQGGQASHRTASRCWNLGFRLESGLRFQGRPELPTSCGTIPARCPLWVRSRHREDRNQCPLCPRKQT